MFTNGLNMGLLQESEWKRQVNAEETHSLVKKKFWAQQSMKMVMVTVFRDMKVPIPIDFLVKGATLLSSQLWVK